MYNTVLKKIKKVRVMLLVLFILCLLIPISSVYASTLYPDMPFEDFKQGLLGDLYLNSDLFTVTSDSNYNYLLIMGPVSKSDSDFSFIHNFYLFRFSVYDKVYFDRSDGNKLKFSGVFEVLNYQVHYRNSDYSFLKLNKNFDFKVAPYYNSYVYELNYNSQSSLPLNIVVGTIHTPVLTGPDLMVFKFGDYPIFSDSIFTSEVEEIKSLSNSDYTGSIDFYSPIDDFYTDNAKHWIFQSNTKIFNTDSDFDSSLWGYQVYVDNNPVDAVNTDGFSFVGSDGASFYKTLWFNLNFTEEGQHTVKIDLLYNNEVIGSSEKFINYVQGFVDSNGDSFDDRTGFKDNSNGSTGSVTYSLGGKNDSSRPAIPEDADLLDYVKYIFDSIGYMISYLLSLIKAMIVAVGSFPLLIASLFAFLPIEVIGILGAALVISVYTLIIKQMRG